MGAAASAVGTRPAAASWKVSSVATEATRPGATAASARAAAPRGSLPRARARACARRREREGEPAHHRDERGDPARVRWERVRPCSGGRSGERSQVPVAADRHAQLGRRERDTVVDEDRGSRRRRVELRHVHRPHSHRQPGRAGRGARDQRAPEAERRRREAHGGQRALFAASTRLQHDQGRRERRRERSERQRAREALGERDAALVRRGRHREGDREQDELPEERSPGERRGVGLGGSGRGRHALRGVVSHARKLPHRGLLG